MHGAEIWVNYVEAKYQNPTRVLGTMQEIHSIGEADSAEEIVQSMDEGHVTWKIFDFSGNFL